MANLRISNEALGVKKFKAVSNKTITDRNDDRICLIMGRLYKSAQCKCPKCKKQFPIYDTPTKNRRWRTLDAFDCKGRDFRCMPAVSDGVTKSF